MSRRDHNEIRIARHAPAPGTCLHLQAAGLLTGFGTSHYRWAPSFFGPSMVTRGRGTFRWPGGQENVKIGSVFALLPDMPVEYWEDPRDPWQYQWLEIHGSDVAAFAAGCGFTRDNPVCHPRDCRPIRDAMRALRDCLDADRPAHPYDIQSKLYGFARQSAEATESVLPHPRERTLVDRAKSLIESHLHTGINVAETAAALQVGRTTLFCAFRRDLHQSPVQYLRERRIGRAREILAADDGIRLADVARVCGFSDQKYFLRTFKQLTGQTPSQWRSAHASRVHPCSPCSPCPNLSVKPPECPPDRRKSCDLPHRT